VLIAIDYISLNFIKYPFKSGGEFSGAAVIDIEEGFEINDGTTKFTIRKEGDIVGFQRAGSQLVPFIGCVVAAAVHLAGGELEIQFDDRSVIRLLISPQGFDSYDVHFEG